MRNIAPEINFKTARSGGKGGQNVNKVESMVEGYWAIQDSQLFTQEEKDLLAIKLSHRLTKNGLLLVKSQEDRSQLGNKAIVIEKMKALVERALVIPKKRKPTKPSKASILKRIMHKKRNAEIKSLRKKPAHD